jgi:DNA-binding protein Fis
MIVSHVNRHVLMELPAGLAFAVLSILLANTAALILTGYGQSGILLAILVAAYCSALAMAMYSLCNFAFMISGRLWRRRRERFLRAATLMLVALLVTESLFIFWGTDQWPFPWKKDSEAPLIQLLFASIAGGILLISTLYKGALDATNLLDRLRCKILWLASGVFLAISLVYLMPILAGIHGPGPVYPAFMIAMLASGFVLMADSDRLVILTALIPGTPENTMHRKIHAAGKAATNIKNYGAELNYREMVLEFEMAIIDYILNECDGSQRKAAGILGLSESTLSRRIVRMKGKGPTALYTDRSPLQKQKSPIRVQRENSLCTPK